MALRHRSATAKKSSHLSKQHLKARGIRAAARWAVETLEPRYMLTTLVGGDTFLFRNQDGHLQEIKAFGNITAEIIGSNVDGGNNVVLEDLPGVLNGNINIGGGLNIPPGAMLVGNINISNPGGPAITAPPASIAVNPATGQMFGIVVQTIPQQGMTPASNIAVLVAIDKNTGNGTVVADITGQILAAAGIAPGTMGAVVTSAPGAAFNPANGLLYFTGTTGTTTQGGTTGGNEKLFTVDVNNPAASVAGIGNQNLTVNASAVEFGNNGLTVSSGMNLVAVNANTGVAGATVATTANGPISGVAQANGSTFMITNSGANSEVYTVDPATGRTVDLGPLPNGNLGQNPGDLTYDPTTNTLYSFDAVTKQLFIVSQVNRTRDLSIFQIYISASDSSGSIVTSRMASDDPANLGTMTPYSTGIEGSLRVANAQTGKVTVIASPAGTGDALVGARTRTIDPKVTDADLIPITTAVLGQTFNTAPYAIGQTITAGIVSAAGTTVGQVMIGGTVMGQVHLAGSINTFYAGWLLTGDARGLPQEDISDPGNFTVAGDIRNLITTASIGTDSDAALTRPTYVTGFDMSVGGTLGQVHTFDSLIGNVNVIADPAAPSFTGFYKEVETRTIANPPASQWVSGVLGGSPIFTNDTFQTPQYVAALPTTQGGTPSTVFINGMLQATTLIGDFNDFYGVSLLAGQTVTVQLTQLIPPPLLIDVGIFDPDGREIATDYSSIQLSQTQQLPFQFTADRPGVYRFAVAEVGNGTFAVGGRTLGHVGTVPYDLTIQGVGNLPVGAVAAATNILDNVGFTPQASFSTLHGDFGALTAGGKIMSFNPNNTVVVPAGNLRDMDASSIGNGVLNGTVLRITADPEIQVPNGSVGLISATGTGPADLLFFNEPFTTPPPIGGDYQVVSGAAEFSAYLIANQNIGVIRAGSMTLPDPGQFRAGFNNQYGHAFIDLVDVAGDMGTIGGGGPAISTGVGGDFRYMKVGGQFWRDAFFGTGTPEPTIFSPGVGATIIDDSGSAVNLVPNQAIPNPIFDATITDINDPRSIQTIPAGQITVTTYGIEGAAGSNSGGSAIVDVTSTGDLTVTTTGDVPGQSAEIGRIEIQGLGTAVNDTTAVTPALIGNATGIIIPAKKNTQPSTPTTTTGGTTTGGTTTGGTTTGGTTTGGTTTGAAVTPTPASIAGAPSVAGLQMAAFGLPLYVNIGGSVPTDVLNIVVTGNDPAHVTFGNATQITNSTGGEMVSILAASIGQLISTGTIGLAKRHTAAAVNPQQVLVAGDTLPTPRKPLEADRPVDPMPSVVYGNLYPFMNQTIGVEIIHGNIFNVQGSSLGNFLVEGGSIGNLTATSDGSLFGIAGPIAVYDFSVTSQGDGHAIFAQMALPNAGRLLNVNIGQGGIAPSGTGNLSFAGIYTDNEIGNVVGHGDVRGSIDSAVGIGSIKLTGGSFINTHLGQYSRQADTREIAPFIQVPSYLTPLDAPKLDIGTISTTGGGGLIGVEIVADHIGIIQVTGGFGIFNTAILVQADGTLGTIRADGYGIRQTEYRGGANLGAVIATGNGTNVSTQNFSSSVRQSETHTFDPFTGFMPNLLTDINISTGATALTPQIPGFNGGGTDTGVIEDFIGVGSRDLGTVSAYQIRATDPVLLPTMLDFANTIGTIKTLSTIDGLSIVTGRVTNFNPGSDVSHLDMRISGRINKINIKGSLLGNSSISALGPNGNIGTIIIAHSLVGSITATRKIGTVTIGQNLAGAMTARSLSTLKIKGSISGGNLDILGNVGTLQTGGDLGLSGETLTIHGAISTIKVGGNINCNIVVQGKLGTLQSGGSIVTGSATNVTGVLTTLKVNGDVQSGSSVTASRIKRKIVKGLIQGTITP